MTAVTMRLAGIVEPSPRGPLLRIEDGTTWRLIYEEALDHLLGRAVTVEGIRRGSAIAAYYLAPLAPVRPC
ncbi:DUF5818 domain-containing protein (plasmid) [Sphingobium naphthae]|uniref:DUF5818 domain-containing protein n=1 Tax=Sphingobium naphthae TaxID=1886786 RepID=UPI000C93D9A3|nr:hypothetical protein [Erythrobacter sp.]MEA3388291.1 DUF5818 domain-containing protein [Pseudomonadota bacterium]|tara:strand:+ start:1474 stop:1686 length:213 start_codon:yes stop_codon:yes gene_type:complete